MHLEEKVSEAKISHQACDELIREYHNFILSVTSKVTGKFVTEHDDETSIAMIAFSEAIEKYEAGKGKFLSFATLMIRSRLIDHMRGEQKNTSIIPFSALSNRDQDGKEVEFDVEDRKQEKTDIQYEIAALTEELKGYEISFLELSKDSPKSKKTRKACFEILNYILNQPQLIKEIKKNGVFPVKTILENLNVHRKIMERHRKYILTGLIVLTGDYSCIAEYFSEVKGAIL